EGHRAALGHQRRAAAPAAVVVLLGLTVTTAPAAVQATTTGAAVVVAAVAAHAERSVAARVQFAPAGAPCNLSARLPGSDAVPGPARIASGAVPAVAPAARSDDQ